MNSTAKCWLLWMMIPLFIGVVIFFLVPLQIIVNSNPRLEDSFNNYRIEVEQNAVRAISYLSSRIVASRMQMFRNFLITFKKLIARNLTNSPLNFDCIKLNSAYELANLSPNQSFVKAVPMWYSPNTGRIAEMNPTQKTILNNYITAVPYMMQALLQKNQLQSAIKNSQTFLTDGNQTMYFQYPSVQNRTFMELGQNTLNALYLDTIENYQITGRHMSMFQDGAFMQICGIVFFHALQPNGVTCLELDTGVLLMGLEPGNKPTDLSVNQYYYLRPIYQFQNLNDPQIIANFSSININKIQIPQQQFFSLKNSQLSRSLFLSNRHYSMNVQRSIGQRTYYTIPIFTFNSNNILQILLYLVVSNNFARASFSDQSRNDRITTVMVVPAILILVVSTVFTTLVLRIIFKRLDDVLKMMQDYCSLMQRDDLELEIQDYDGAEDLRELLRELAKLNQLSKYSDYQYFNVPKPERIVRLLKCMRLFEELGYNMTNLYENISECYIEIGDNEKAIQFMRKSIENSINETYEHIYQIDQIYEKKLIGTYKSDKSLKKKEKNLVRKIVRICQLLQQSNPDFKSIQKQLGKYSSMGKKIIFPEILSFQSIICYIYQLKSQVRKQKASSSKKKLQTIYQLITGYSQINYKHKNLQATPQILLSDYNYLCMNLALQQKRYIQAYDLCVQVLRGNQFNPALHEKANMHIQKILSISHIHIDISDFRFMHQYRSKGQRQFVFLVDVSNPDMTFEDVNLWKKKARTLADHIFTTLMSPTDRISITEFCLDIKIICNLVQKANRQKILKKELLSSIKARDKNITSSLLPCIRKSVQRVKHLKNEKIFIIFLKEPLQIRSADLYEEFMGVGDVRVLVFCLGNYFGDRIPELQIMNYEDLDDVNRILGDKVIKRADNLVYIF